jgi:hypothetical protein
MERFHQPIKYSTDGIIPNNSLEKSIIEFCVKVGVDPKYYHEIFEDIKLMDGMNKPTIGKRLTFSSCRK